MNPLLGFFAPGVLGLVWIAVAVLHAGFCGKCCNRRVR